MLTSNNNNNRRQSTDNKIKKPSAVTDNKDEQKRQQPRKQQREPSLSSKSQPIVSGSLSGETDAGTASLSSSAYTYTTEFSDISDENEYTLNHQHTQLQQSQGQSQQPDNLDNLKAASTWPMPAGPLGGASSGAFLGSRHYPHKSGESGDPSGGNGPGNESSLDEALPPRRASAPSHSGLYYQLHPSRKVSEEDVLEAEAEEYAEAIEEARRRRCQKQHEQISELSPLSPRSSSFISERKETAEDNFSSPPEFIQPTIPGASGGQVFKHDYETAVSPTTKVTDVQSPEVSNNSNDNNCDVGPPATASTTETVATSISAATKATEPFVAPTFKRGGMMKVRHNGSISSSTANGNSGENTNVNSNINNKGDYGAVKEPRRLRFNEHVDTKVPPQVENDEDDEDTPIDDEMLRSAARSSVRSSASSVASSCISTTSSIVSSATTGSSFSATQGMYDDEDEDHEDLEELEDLDDREDEQESPVAVANETSADDYKTNKDGFNAQDADRKMSSLSSATTRAAPESSSSAASKRRGSFQPDVALPLSLSSESLEEETSDENTLSYRFPELNLQPSRQPRGQSDLNEVDADIDDDDNVDNGSEDDVENKLQQRAQQGQRERKIKFQPGIKNNNSRPPIYLTPAPRMTTMKMSNYDRPPPPMDLSGSGSDDQSDPKK